MKETDNKIVAFVIPALGDARSRTRIEALKREGAQARIFGFKRDIYNGAPYQDPVILLGKLPHGRYFVRLGTYLKALLLLIKHGRQARSVYVLGLDLALLAWMALLGRRSSIKLVLEIQDIRSVLLKKGIKGALARQVEKFIVPRVDTLVVTSAAYVDDYYVSRVGIDIRSSYIIENKVDDTPVMRRQRDIARAAVNPDGSLCIGYFGMLRCRRTLDIILGAADAAQGKIRFYLRGVLHETEDYANKIRNHPFIEYGGEYRSPDELGFMYGKVDLVWACYPDAGRGTGNWLWARTNRFYEACYFGKPVIAATGTEDGKAVDAYNIGFCVNLQNQNESIAALLAIEGEKLNIWRGNMQKLPQRIYVYESEHRNLLSDILGFPQSTGRLRNKGLKKTGFGK
jgi:succinoglycan biosynthesis protein ExoL